MNFMEISQIWIRIHSCRTHMSNAKIWKEFSLPHGIDADPRRPYKRNISFSIQFNPFTFKRNFTNIQNVNNYKLHSIIMTNCYGIKALQFVVRNLFTLSTKKKFKKFSSTSCVGGWLLVTSFQCPKFNKKHNLCTFST